MRILHVTPCYEPAWEQGGVVTAISTLCRHMASHGADVHVYTTNLNPPHRLDVQTNRELDVGGVRVTYFEATHAFGTFLSRSLTTACLANIKRFDIVHVASFWNYPAIPAFAACIGNGVPFVISPHGALLYYTGSTPQLRNIKWWRIFLWQNLINDPSFRAAAALHFAAELEERACLKRFKAARTFVVPNALELPLRDDRPRDEIRSTFGLPREGFLISYVGRLAEGKAIDILVRGVALARRAGLPIALAFANPSAPKMERTLKDLARDLGIAEHVYFLGFISAEVRDRLLSATDCVSLATTGDNFGYTAVEALAIGVPILVSENVGIAPQVIDANAGLLVSVSPEGISDGLTRILADESTRERMGRAARKLAENAYSAPVVAGAMLDEYRAIVAARGRRKVS